MLPCFFSQKIESNYCILLPLCGGVTLGSVKTRKGPNCFNFLRQVEVLCRAGEEASFTVAWWNKQIKYHLFINSYRSY